MARILHLIASNHRRGAETFAVELAAHLRGVGHDVRVMAVEDAGVDVPLPVEVAGNRRTDPRVLLRVLRAARRSDVTVSFGSTSLLVGAAAAAAARRPFVYRNIGDPSVWGAARFADLRVGAPVRHAQVVVALWPGAAASLTERYRIDPSRIAVIPRGVPAERFPLVGDTDRAQARAGLSLDPERHWVAYVGALSEEKDPLLAVEAVGALGDDVGLLVAGDGPLRERVRNAGRGLGDRLRLLGTVGDVRPVLAASDALVLPSRTEGIPGVAVEAGLSGLPVVAFDVGGVAAVVSASTGVIVGSRTTAALAAGIVRAVEHRRELGGAARQHCLEGFSMDQVGRKWEDVIERAVGSGRDRRSSR